MATKKNPKKVANRIKRWVLSSSRWSCASGSLVLEEHQLAEAVTRELLRLKVGEVVTIHNELFTRTELKNLPEFSD